ncbi:hypothetical protein ACIQ1D_18795 [Lysinibacillus xylanilyticus]|uniref:hypothetical protein n=1 Tax=Lysinibacillus xylanilyticus TaxID=582475 RepID=UPI0038033D0F
MNEYTLEQYNAMLEEGVVQKNTIIIVKHALKCFVKGTGSSNPSKTNGVYHSDKGEIVSANAKGGLYFKDVWIKNARSFNYNPKDNYLAYDCDWFDYSWFDCTEEKYIEGGFNLIASKPVIEAIKTCNTMSRTFGSKSGDLRVKISGDKIVVSPILKGEIEYMEYSLDVSINVSNVISKVDKEFIINGKMLLECLTLYNRLEVEYVSVALVNDKSKRILIKPVLSNIEGCYTIVSTW